MRTFSVVLPARHIIVSKENSDNGLTDFLDFFLTKFFRERDVKKC